MSSANASNVTLSPFAPSEETCYLIRVLYVLSAMNGYYTPFVIIVGSITNVIASITLRHTKLKKSPTSQYLAAKCITDSVFLACVGILWLTHMGLPSIQTDAFCPYLWLASQTSNFLSVWLVVVVCFERHIVVCGQWWSRNPRDSSHKPCFSVLCSQLTIIAMVILGVVVYVNISHTIGAIHHKRTSICAPLPMFMKSSRLLHKLDLVINVIAPYLLVLILNICTWRGILRVSALRKGTIAHHEQGTVVLCPKTEIHLTKTVCIYSAIFLMLTLPTQSLRVLHDVRDTLSIHVKLGVRELLWQHVTQVIFHTSFSANFFVLLASHRTFRKALRQLLFSWFYRFKSTVANLRRPQREYLGIQAFQFTVEFSSTLVRLKETNLG